jgi:hypothetical protein
VFWCMLLPLLTLMGSPFSWPTLMPDSVPDCLSTEFRPSGHCACAIHTLVKIAHRPTLEHSDIVAHTPDYRLAQSSDTRAESLTMLKRLPYLHHHLKPPTTSDHQVLPLLTTITIYTRKQTLTHGVFLAALCATSLPFMPCMCGESAVL